MYFQVWADLVVVVHQLSKCAPACRVFTRDSIYVIARICHGNSVCLSVRHTGESVKNG